MTVNLVAPQTTPVRRLRVEHTTGFRYETTVAASYNEARMTPLASARQTVLDSRIVVDPVTWVYPYRDYWGTQVTAFEALTPHTELSVVSSSTVEVYQPTRSEASTSWEALARAQVTDPHHEWLTQTASTEPVAEVVQLAQELASGKSPDAAARAICERLHSLIDYVPGATSVNSSATDVWQTKQGVCQDLAHLTLGALRSLGIPARYASGYLHPRPDADLGEIVEGASHAWVEWWAGDWMGYDTTHAKDIGENHVLVAVGRDYGDVTPLKGVYAGSGTSELFVTVAFTRLT